MGWNGWFPRVSVIWADHADLDHADLDHADLATLHRKQ
jgi:hypothetical protein